MDNLPNWRRVEEIVDSSTKMQRVKLVPIDLRDGTRTLQIANSTFALLIFVLLVLPGLNIVEIVMWQMI